MSVDASRDLLSWYDGARRDLPWRAPPGATADPYRVWLSEIMLQQTTVAAVRPYFAAFTRRWPDVGALAAADEGEVMAAWAGLGYYARARNLVACARTVVERHGGRFPDEEAALRALPGIGAYTAAAVAAIAFGRRAVPVDANIERVVARLSAIRQPLPGAKRTIAEAAERLVPERRAGDFAQAMMDLGATVCAPRAPDCPACPIRRHCAAARTGDPSAFPVKAPKKPRPTRAGTAWWLESDGHVLLVRRPARGLLGGMLALPTDEAGAGPPARLPWEEAGRVAHVFTHFALDMRLMAARTGRAAAPDGLWHPLAALGEAGLPTLFAKLARVGAGWSSERLAAGGPTA